jgi:T5orf172 domain
LNCNVLPISIEIRNHFGLLPFRSTIIMDGWPQDKAASDDERGSTTSHPTTNQKVGSDTHAAVRRPIPKEQTPFRHIRPNSASSVSSSGSSAASIIFDDHPVRVETPITPPISETPDSNNTNKRRHAGHGELSFVEKCVDSNDSSSATHTPPTIPAGKTFSRTSSPSDLLVEDIGKLSVQDSEGYPDQDGSPSRAKKPNGKARGRQAVQEKGGYFNLLSKSNKANRKDESRDTSRTNESTDQVEDDVALETRPAKSNVQRGLSLGRDTSRSKKRRVSESPPLVAVRSDNEGKETSEGISSETTQNPLLSGQHQRLKATQSAIPASHKRSKSESTLQDTNDPTVPDNLPAKRVSRKNLSSQPHRANASLLDPARVTENEKRRRTSAGTVASAPAGHKPRRRSTGSLESEQTLISSTKSPSPSEVERIPGAFPAESIALPEHSRQSPSSEPLLITPELKPDESRKFPKLEHKHLMEKNANDLKNDILRIIRRQNKKPPAESNLTHGYVYIFKSERFPGYVKIGSTVRAPEDRIKEWKTRCEFKAIRVSDENDKAFRFCRIVEQIVHAELYNEQRKFYCDICKSGHVLKMVEKKAEQEEETGKKELDLRPTEHGEWFEISETKAKEVVNKWRNWVIYQDPYKPDATLRPCWLWKYDMGTKWLKGTEADWEADWAAWRQFSWLDYCRHGWYDFNQWLGEVAPPLQTLMKTSGSVLVVAAGLHLWASGGSFASFLRVMSALLLYRFIFSKC